LFQTITKISNNWLIETGLLSFFAGLVLAAFSNTTRLFFNGKCTATCFSGTNVMI